MHCLLVISVTACLFSVQAVTSVRHPRQSLADGSLVDFLPNADNLLAGSRFRRQAANCKKNSQWTCRDKSCISLDEVCDGIVHCRDGSDETQAVCGRKRCPSHLFQCSYGACVDGDAKCNGVKDCADNSDEENKDCIKTAPVVNNCVRGRWQCNNGQCIDEGDVCDGRKDCTDGSDETVVQCSMTKCKSFLVRCAYGACVDGDAECNNIAECADNSDEDPAKCTGRPGWVPQEVTTVTPTSRPPVPTPPTQPDPVIPLTEGCKLPDFPYDGRYAVSNYKDKTIVPGDVVGEFTILTYSCKKGFDLTTPLSVCQEGNAWSAMPECNRRCTMPTSYTVDFICYSLTGQIPCASTLPNGTTIHSTCKDAHVPLEDLLVMTCRSGSWDNPTPKCNPDCGLEKAFSVSHIVHGSTAKKDTFPWHMAIFQEIGNPVPDQICGGSLVRAHVVISAAHCFFDPINNVAIDARYYKVVAGKFYRSWDSEADNRLSYVQRSEVKQLILHEFYKGDEQNQQNDIAILVLTTPFKLSDSVRPVCIDLNSEELNKVQVGTGKRGKVAGWGRTETGQPSEELKSIELPVIEYNECRLEMAKYKFTRYLTRDKLCAGYINGSALCQGDSGGGLVFPIQDFTNNNRWYLRGVVSNGPLNDEMTTCRANTYTAFTEIFKLKDWLSPQLRKLT